MMLNPNGGGIAINTDSNQLNSIVIMDPSMTSSAATWNGWRFIGGIFNYTGATTTTTTLVEVTLQSPSITSINAWTVSDFYLFNIGSAPQSGSNVTITRNWSLYVAGNTKFGGSQQWHAKVINSAGPYTILAPTNSSTGDCVLQVTYTATAAIVLNLPATSGVQSGFLLVIVDSGYNAAVNNITVTAAGTDKINNGSAGGSAVIATNGGVLCLVADATTGNWELTNAYGGASRGAYYSPQVTSGLAVNLALGNYQRIVLANGANTLSVSGQQGGGRYLLKLVQPSSGSAGTVTWPSTFRWAGGVAPTLTTTSNYADLVAISYDATGAVFDADCSPAHAN
jgi:hypothetical protein